MPCINLGLPVEQVDAILIVPKFRRYWQALMWELPVVAQFDLQFHDRLYTIGSRAPPSMKLNKPGCLLTNSRTETGTGLGIHSKGW